MGQGARVGRPWQKLRRLLTCGRAFRVKKRFTHLFSGVCSSSSPDLKTIAAPPAVVNRTCYTAQQNLMLCRSELENNHTAHADMGFYEQTEAARGRPGSSRTLDCTCSPTIGAFPDRVVVSGIGSSSHGPFSQLQHRARPTPATVSSSSRPSRGFCRANKLNTFGRQQNPPKRDGGRATHHPSTDLVDREWGLSTRSFNYSPSSIARSSIARRLVRQPGRRRSTGHPPDEKWRAVTELLRSPGGNNEGLQRLAHQNRLVSLLQTPNKRRTHTHAPTHAPKPRPQKSVLPSEDPTRVAVN